MKTLIISAVLLILVILGLVANAVYIERLTENLNGLAVSLPSTVADMQASNTVYETTVELYQCFYDNEPFIALSLGYAEIERMKSAVISMKNAVITDNMNDFFAARERLISYLHRLECNELVSFDNIC